MGKGEQNFWTHPGALEVLRCEGVSVHFDASRAGSAAHMVFSPTVGYGVGDGVQVSCGPGLKSCACSGEQTSQRSLRSCPFAWMFSLLIGGSRR